MRGTVLLLVGQAAPAVYAEYFRANGLLVYEAGRAEDAVKDVSAITPDVVVTDFGPSVVHELRNHVDYATSIIVVSDREESDQERAAGADCFIAKPAPLNEILYEVHRALILRRSGRRLPWNRRRVSKSAVTGS